MNSQKLINSVQFVASGGQLGHSANTNTQRMDTMPTRVLYNSDLTVNPGILQDSRFVMIPSETTDPDFGYLVTGLPTTAEAGASATVLSAYLAGGTMTNVPNTAGTMGINGSPSVLGPFPLELTGGSGYQISQVVGSNFDRGRTETSRTTIVPTLIQAGSSNLQGLIWGAMTTSTPGPDLLNKPSLNASTSGAASEFFSAPVTEGATVIQKGSDSMNYFSNQAVIPNSQITRSLTTRSLNPTTLQNGGPVALSNFLGPKLFYYRGSADWQSTLEMIPVDGPVRSAFWDVQVFSDWAYVTDAGALKIVSVKDASSTIYWEQSPVGNAGSAPETINLCGSSVCPTPTRSSGASPIPMFFFGHRLVIVDRATPPQGPSAWKSIISKFKMSVYNTDITSSQLGSIVCLEDYFGPVSISRSVNYRVIPNAEQGSLLNNGLQTPLGNEYVETLADVNMSILGHGFGFIGTTRDEKKYVEQLSTSDGLWNKFASQPHGRTAFPTSDTVSASGNKFKNALRDIGRTARTAAHIAHDGAVIMASPMSLYDASAQHVYEASPMAAYSAAPKSTPSYGSNYRASEVGSDLSTITVAPLAVKENIGLPLLSQVKRAGAVTRRESNASVLKRVIDTFCARLKNYLSNKLVQHILTLKKRCPFFSELDFSTSEEVLAEQFLAKVMGSYQSPGSSPVLRASGNGDALRCTATLLHASGKPAMDHPRLKKFLKARPTIRNAVFHSRVVGGHPDRFLTQGESVELQSVLRDCGSRFVEGKVCCSGTGVFLGDLDDDDDDDEQDDEDPSVQGYFEQPDYDEDESNFAGYGGGPDGYTHSLEAKRPPSLLKDADKPGMFVSDLLAMAQSAEHEKYTASLHDRGAMVVDPSWITKPNSKIGKAVAESSLKGCITVSTASCTANFPLIKSDEGSTATMYVGTISFSPQPLGRAMDGTLSPYFDVVDDVNKNMLRVTNFVNQKSNLDHFIGVMALLASLGLKNGTFFVDIDSEQLVLVPGCIEGPSYSAALCACIMGLPCGPIITGSIDATGSKLLAVGDMGAKLVSSQELAVQLPTFIFPADDPQSGHAAVNQTVSAAKVMMRSGRPFTQGTQTLLAPDSPFELYACFTSGFVNMDTDYAKVKAESNLTIYTLGEQVRAAFIVLAEVSQKMKALPGKDPVRMAYTQVMKALKASDPTAVFTLLDADKLEQPDWVRLKTVLLRGVKQRLVVANKPKDPKSGAKLEAEKMKPSIDAYVSGLARRKSAMKELMTGTKGVKIKDSGVVIANPAYTREAKNPASGAYVVGEMINGKIPDPTNPGAYLSRSVFVPALFPLEAGTALKKSKTVRVNSVKYEDLF